ASRLRECAGPRGIDQRDHHIKCHQQGHCLETAGGREGRRVQQDKDAGPEESIEDEHDLKHRGEWKRYRDASQSTTAATIPWIPLLTITSMKLLCTATTPPYSAPATTGIPFGASAWAFSFPVRSVRTIAKLTMM